MPRRTPRRTVASGSWRRRGTSRRTPPTRRRGSSARWAIRSTPRLRRRSRRQSPTSRACWSPTTRTRSGRRPMPCRPPSTRSPSRSIRPRRSSRQRVSPATRPALPATAPRRRPRRKSSTRRSSTRTVPSSSLLVPRKEPPVTDRDQGKRPAGAPAAEPRPAGAPTPPAGPAGAPKDEHQGTRNEEGNADQAAAIEHDFDALVADVKRERDEYLELAQRARADFENYRRRAAREAHDAERRGKTTIARELVPALDN